LYTLPTPQCTGIGFTKWTSSWRTEGGTYTEKAESVVGRTGYQHNQEPIEDGISLLDSKMDKVLQAVIKQ
jgi:hypothetical protein